MLNALYNTAGVRLPDRSYLVIVLNAQPSCYSSVAGLGDVGFVEYTVAYGTVRVAVTQYYHYADWLAQVPDVVVFVHEFGHNLGLHHPGTLANEYDNVWDAVGGFRAFVRLSSWLGTTTYFISRGLSLPHLYYLGVGQFVGTGAGSWLVGPRSGVYVSASDGVYTVEYKCSGVYEQFIDWCGVVVHRVSSSASGRWVFFHTVLNVTGRFVSPVNFLDVGQSARVAGQRVSVVWRNSTHARVVVGLPTLADVVGANVTFVVGSRAAAVDSVVEARVRHHPRGG